MSSVKANFYGVLAILLWSTLIGLMRTLTESFGVLGGAALIYSIGALALCLRQGLPKVRSMPPVYVLGCGALFVAYSIALPVGVGCAVDARQVMEVGLLNYLWPALIVALGVWLNGLRLRWWGWAGIALCLLGVYACMSAEHGFDPAGFAANILAAPLPYALGLAAAFSWGLYCNISSRYARGHNGMPLFFIILALVMWGGFWAAGDSLPAAPGWRPVLVLVLVGLVYGLSYSLWETGLQQGSLLLLGVLSYFTPVFSMAFTGLWLQTLPPAGFWAGVALVIAGSLVSWLASRAQKVRSDIFKRQNNS